MQTTGLLPYLDVWAGYFKLSNDFSLTAKKNALINIQGFYITNQVNDIFRFTSFGTLSASVKWLLLDKKLTLSVYVNDIFRSFLSTATLISNDIERRFLEYCDLRYVRLSVSYNFGKRFRVAKREGKNIEEYRRTR